MHGDLLHTKADPTSLSERNEEFVKILTLLIGSNPSLRLEAPGIGEYFRVHVDEIAGHTYR